MLYPRTYVLVPYGTSVSGKIMGHVQHLQYNDIHLSHAS